MTRHDLKNQMDDTKFVTFTLIRKKVYGFKPHCDTQCGLVPIGGTGTSTEELQLTKCYFVYQVPPISLDRRKQNCRTALKYAQDPKFWVVE